MNGDQPKRPTPHWTVEEAEALLLQLEGVISAQIVATPRGEVEEVHLLTTGDVSPKNTVRNVESALRARFDLSIDHRKVSVARTHAPTPDPPKKLFQQEKGSPTEGPLRPDAGRAHDEPVGGGVNRGVIESPWGFASSAAGPRTRAVFVRHRQERERTRRVRMTVELEWADVRYSGSATTPDLPRGRREATAEATLEAIRAIVSDVAPSAVTLDLDGVEIVEALDQRYTLVAVHGLIGGRFSPLTGVVPIEDDAEQAIILATLRATERPVRIALAGSVGLDRTAAREDVDPPRDGDPLTLWGGG